MIRADSKAWPGTACVTEAPARTVWARSMPALALGLVLAALPPLAQSHHSYLARFDRQSIAELEGVLIEKRWRNPHGSFVLRVTDADGTVTDWEIETSSVSLMQRLGIRPEMLAIGETIRIAGYPPVSSKREMYARHILLADGRELMLDIGLTPRWADRTDRRVGEHSQVSVRAGDASHPELGIFRVWSLIRDGRRLFPEVVDPTFDAQSYPMTPAARAALAAFDPARDNPTAKCTPKGMPTIMEQPYPIEFVALDNGDIRLHIEEYDLDRVIFMDPAHAPREPAPSLLGTSVGRFDDRTLVVRTTRISWPYFSQIGIPQSPAAEIVERFTPTDDGSRLDYALTVTDPANFTEPVTLRNFWIWVPEVEILPYECSER
jgi:Family of unknown function (DUF6152)